MDVQCAIKTFFVHVPFHCSVHDFVLLFSCHYCVVTITGMLQAMEVVCCKKRLSDDCKGEKKREKSAFPCTSSQGKLTNESGHYALNSVDQSDTCWKKERKEGTSVKVCQGLNLSVSY